MISADILLKGLGGLAVVGGATTVGVCYKQETWIFAKKKVETLEELAKKVGLVCKETNTETLAKGINCTKNTDTKIKINVKKESTPFELDSLGSSGKIKVYKTSEGEKHNNDFKFVIEEGDIGTDTNNKLEEFETYEIKEDGGKHYLTKKTSVNDGIKKALGLPGDCDLPTTAEVKSCDLDDAKFKKINFDGGNEERGTVPTGAKLKISKVDGEDYGNKYKFKFVLESAQDAKISKTVTIKANTNTEFKIKATAATGGGAKTLSLEKAWTLDSLRAKVGIATCTDVSGGTGKECGFDSAKVNLFNGASDYTKGASVKSEDASKKIKVEEGQPEHSQGFKFYTEETDGITLQNGTPTGTGEKKIEKKDTSNNTPTYEIKEQTPTDAGAKGWYLSKVTKTQGGGGT